MRRPIPIQYFIETGETFKDACLRLSKTHTVTEACTEIGYAHMSGFKHAMRTRGIEVEFRTRADKAKQPTNNTRRTYSFATYELAEQYAKLRIAGHTDEGAADKVGVSARALRRYLQQHMPVRWLAVKSACANYRSKTFKRAKVKYD